MEKKTKKFDFYVVLLLILGLIFILIGIGLLYMGETVTNSVNQLNELVDELGNPFENIGSVNTNILTYTSPHYNPYLILYFRIPAITLFICSFLTCIAAYFLHNKKRQKLVYIGINTSLFGVILSFYLVISTIIYFSWVYINVMRDLTGDNIMCSALNISLLIIVIVAVIIILLSRKHTKRFLEKCYKKM